MTNDSEYYLAPRQFTSKYQRYYDMKVGETIELEMPSFKVSAMVVTLHRNKSIVRKEHRRYSVRTAPSVNGEPRCFITRQA